LTSDVEWTPSSFALSLVAEDKDDINLLNYELGARVFSNPSQINTELRVA
jgi:hypothetical protein